MHRDPRAHVRGLFEILGSPISEEALDVWLHLFEDCTDEMLDTLDIWVLTNAEPPNPAEIKRRIGHPGALRTTKIVSRAAQRAGIGYGQILGTSKSRLFVEARQAAWAELHAAGFSKSEIARFFNRDPSTVASGIARHASRSPQIPKEELNA